MAVEVSMTEALWVYFSLDARDVNDGVVVEGGGARAWLVAASLEQIVSESRLSGFAVKEMGGQPMPTFLGYGMLVGKDEPRLLVEQVHILTRADIEAALDVDLDRGRALPSWVLPR
jgi:hypothetical protein